MAVHDGRVFRVEFVSGDQWKVIDAHDESVFVGTMREVEDWLDYHDNLRPRSVSPGVWLQNFVDAFRRH